MVTFLPYFSNLSIDDAMRVQLSNDEKFDVDMKSSRSEFIFLLDRSGSMWGERMEKAKEALILFLQSLPINSYFNIISFGSNFQFMYKESIKYE